jgi:hypothetical protein
MLDALIERQAGVITAVQARAAGLSAGAIRRHLETGRWSPMLHGVYCAFAGPPTRPARLWAVLLRAGRGAVLSHETAAELLKLVDAPAARIHVTIPPGRRISPMRGVVVHRRDRVAEVSATGPPLRRTRIEDTVLDLAAAAPTSDAAIAWITTACGRRLTTPRRLVEAMAHRKRMRRRGLLVRVLDDTAAGTHSVLERRYLRDVERGHRLPRGRRQARPAGGGPARYRDVEYARFGTVVELDGRAYHPEERRSADRRRDNDAAIDGWRTLRYGWTDVTAACRTAIQVGRALRTGGWLGRPRHCPRPDCTLRRSTRRLRS